MVNLDQNGDCCDDMSIEQLLPLGSPDSLDDFGVPEIPPRVGYEFQVEIPPLVVESRSSQDYTFHLYYTGLPIPLMWIAHGDGCTKPVSFESFRGETIPPGFTFSARNNAKKIDISDDEQLEVNVGQIGESENLPRGCPGYTLMPEKLSESWNDSERSIFLVGLYIFEKNFVQLSRFMEDKEMGAILSYYYGRFYGSDEYRRWWESRKMRSKRCVYGQKIFSGLRQQELLSRLLPTVSEECRMALLEVSKSFGEGKIQLEDYVYSLKSMVGMCNLMEAIAIGKGKKDLTGMALESSRSNNITRPEIPTGKACSALTSSEIIMFLTGGYRLSKARSNDLFWEAVWPCLLARGWHSEQPNDEGYCAAGSKSSLVFLVPGVKKFSRRKLTIGHDYFDSVTDVLSRVAKEPELLELKAEDGCNENKEENDESKLDDDRDLQTRQRHCYLQPRTPIRGSDVLRFTVVDTSLPGGKPYKVRELKSLSVEISEELSSSQNCFEDRHGDIPDESDNACAMLINASEMDNTSIGITKSNGEMFLGNKDQDVSEQEMKATSLGISDISGSELKTEKCPDDDGQERNEGKSRLTRKPEQEKSDRTAPISKRRHALFPCSREETSDARLENEMSTSSSGIHVNSGLSNCSPTGSSECCLDAECPRALIDLNMPQVPTDVGIGVIISEQSKEQTARLNERDVEQQQDVQPRRQSTRNRPPTARALEALANGFLSVKQRKKYSRTISDNMMAPDEVANRRASPHSEAAAETVVSTGPESNLNC